MRQFEGFPLLSSPAAIRPKIMPVSLLIIRQGFRCRRVMALSRKFRLAGVDARSTPYWSSARIVGVRKTASLWIRSATSTGLRVPRSMSIHMLVSIITPTDLSTPLTTVYRQIWRPSAIWRLLLPVIYRKYQRKLREHAFLSFRGQASRPDD